jgi:hypothetical protein
MSKQWWEPKQPCEKEVQLPKLYDTEIFKILHEIEGRIVTWQKGKSATECNDRLDFMMIIDGQHFYVRDFGFHRPDEIAETCFDDPVLLDDEGEQYPLFNPRVVEQLILVCVHVYHHREDKFNFAAHQEILLAPNDPNFAYMLQQARDLSPHLELRYQLNVMSDQERYDKAIDLGLKPWEFKKTTDLISVLYERMK